VEDATTLSWSSAAVSEWVWLQRTNRHSRQLRKATYRSSKRTNGYTTADLSRVS